MMGKKQWGQARGVSLDSDQGGAEFFHTAESAKQETTGCDSENRYSLVEHSFPFLARARSRAFRVWVQSRAMSSPGSLKKLIWFVFFFVYKGYGNKSRTKKVTNQTSLKSFWPSTYGISSSATYDLSACSEQFLALSYICIVKQTSNDWRKSLTSGCGCVSKFLVVVIWLVRIS